MNDPQPHGQLPPPGPKPSSTSIDDLLTGGGATHHAADEVQAAATLAPPVAPAPDATAPEPTASKRRGRHNKAKFHLVKDAPMLFFFGLLMLLWGSIMVFDRYGPSTQLDGRVTDLDVSRSRRSTTYSIEGVDERGGRFDTDVRKAVYDRADRGDSVVVTRAWLTGRVTKIDGGSWQHETETWKVIFFSVIGGFGLLLVVITVRAMRRATAADPDPNARTWARRVRWPLAIGLVIAAGWVAYERNQAAGDGRATTTVSEVAEESTAAPTRICGTLSPQTEAYIAKFIDAKVQEGFMSISDFRTMAAAVEFAEPNCATVTLDLVMCNQLRDVKNTNPGFVVVTDGRCPGL